MVSLPVTNSNDLYPLNPSKIIALGLNYHEHVKESGFLTTENIPLDIPSEPVLFPKTPNVLIGTGEPIIIPAYLDGYGFDEVRVDYEAELAFIMGEGGKNIPEGEALDHIFGYTCFNDVSQRNFQTGDKSGWFRGKSLDTFGPIGPVIVPASAIGDPQNLHIECRLNGRVVQRGSTAEMIFPIPTIIAFISRHFTLEAGDIIVTGTPKGVGRIHHGDTVEVEIEGIGTLSNPVIQEGL
jgi:2-keto-4-pentenoate hydratase/2-oxohepta-3-ene-1,7-dioic acid hydratase in catechol pathway